MKYWHHPRFWIALMFNEFAAFLLSAVMAVCVAILLTFAGMNEHHLGFVFKIIGPLINLFLGYCAFCDVRKRAARWRYPQAPGFPVILAGDQNAG